MFDGESISKTKHRDNGEILTAYIINEVRTSYYFMLSNLNCLVNLNYISY